MDNNFNMTFEESQDYIDKRGFDIPWNDCDVFVDEREITRTVGNVLKWADKTMIDKAWDWFYNMALDYMSGDITDVKWGSMKEDFFKAMEE